MRKDLFATPVWEYDLSFNTQGLIKYINSLNTSPSTEFDLWEYCKPNCPLTVIKAVVEGYAKNSISELYPSATVNMDRAWVNTQYKNQGLLPHDHGVPLVGCLYLQTKDTTGDLMLIDPRGSVNWKVVEENGYSGMKAVRVTPTDGKLIFFPGYVTHYVTENHSETPRMSLAMNIHVNFG